VKDLDWLRKTFESQDLVSLSLSLAEALYPNDSWDIEEAGDYAIVANLNRSLVLDMKYYDRLSGQASLLLAGVPDAEPAQREVIAFLQEKRAIDISCLEKMKSDLKRFDQKGTVVPLLP
jgi:hypothetical protein